MTEEDFRRLVGLLDDLVSNKKDLAKLNIYDLTEVHNNLMKAQHLVGVELNYRTLMQKLEGKDPRN